MIKKNKSALLMFLLLSSADSCMQATAADPEIEDIKAQIRQELKANQQHRKVVMGAAAVAVGAGLWHLFKPSATDPEKEFLKKEVIELREKVKLTPEQRAALEGKMDLNPAQKAALEKFTEQERARQDRYFGGTRDFLWNWGVLPGVATFFSTPFARLGLQGYSLCKENYSKIFHDANLKWYNETRARVISVRGSSGGFALMDLFKSDESPKAEIDMPQPESNGLFDLLEKNIDDKEEFEATWRDGYRNVQSLVAFMEIKVEDNPNVESFKIHKNAAQKALNLFVAEYDKGNGQQAFLAFRDSFSKSFKRFCSAERHFSL